MAKLSISDAARACGVARTTIQRAVRTGRLSLDAEHQVDTAELLRVGFLVDAAVLHAASQQGGAATPQDAAPQRSTPQQGDAAQQELQVLRRENAMLQQERDRLVQQMDLLQAQQTLHAVQQRYDRLLEAPRPAPPPAPPAAPEVVRELLRRRPYAELPEVERPAPAPLQDPNRHARRQRILEALAAYPEGLHWREIGRLIGDTGDLNDTLQGMLRYKLVRRVGRGVYALPVIG